MSLDKSIEHGKEHRKPYYGAKRFDKACRNHGDCSWCLENRMHRHKKKQLEGEESMEDLPWNKRNREKHE